jgi:hypothetical protein
MSYNWQMWSRGGYFALERAADKFRYSTEVER